MAMTKPRSSEYKKSPYGSPVQLSKEGTAEVLAELKNPRALNAEQKAMKARIAQRRSQPRKTVSK